MIHRRSNPWIAKLDREGAPACSELGAVPRSLAQGTLTPATCADALCQRLGTNVVGVWQSGPVVRQGATTSAALFQDFSSKTA